MYRKAELEERAKDQYQVSWTLKQCEKHHITTVLGMYAGNVTRACKHLSMGRNTLYRRLKTYGIKVHTPQ